VRQRAVYCVLVALIGHSPSTSLAQAVSEDIHDDVSGPVEMCGVKAADAASLLEAIRRDGRFRALDSGSERFELFATEDHHIQWVATRPGEAAFPAVTCRRVYEDNGGVKMDRRLRCDASREACDALFLEFQALDNSLKAEIRSASKR